MDKVQALSARSNLLDLYDERGVQIAVGDVIKVFHFVGARRKRHYMYKQVMGYKMLGKGTPFVVVSHLNMTDEYFLEQMNGRAMAGWQIVQTAMCDEDERPRRAALSALEGDAP